MRIETELKLNFDDVLLRPKRSTLSSRKDVDLSKSYVFRNSQQSYTGIPIMAANMDGVGTFEIAKKLAEHGMFTCLVKHLALDELAEWVENKGQYIQDNWAYSMGITTADYNKLIEFCTQTRGGMGLKFKYICIDVANGYSESFVAFVRKVRSTFPNHVIIAGNVVTSEMTEELILSGADIVKVGIGPGSVCTTRIKTGVGYPQLSAIIECADAAHGLGGHIIADGGCTCPGDVAKAFAGGADFVMLGGMFAGHNEGGGEVITKFYSTGQVEETANSTPEDRIFRDIFEEKKFVKFYGMSSEAANNKHFGGLKNYRASEGREVLVPYKGELEPTVVDILGGLRSACTYVGASKLKYLPKCATFIRTNKQFNDVYTKGV